MKQQGSILAVAALVTACTGPAPTTPLFELVNETERLEASLVSAHVYGTFAIHFGDPGGTITSGPANFPGNPPGGPGTCVDGLWYNSRGKPTAGSLEQPHPHCIRPSSAIQVVLEPISAMIRAPGVECQPGLPCDLLYFAMARTTPLIGVHAIVDERGLAVTDGFGTIHAYAIDAATLGTTNTRVGTVKFTLEEFDERSGNLFGQCTLDDGDFACLPRVIVAGYQPLDVGGVGTPTGVTGFLWWAPATSPYNY